CVRAAAVAVTGAERCARFAMLSVLTSCGARTRPTANLAVKVAIDVVRGSVRLRNRSSVRRRRTPSLAPVERRSALRHALAVDALPPPLTFFLLMFSGWANRHQQAVIEYLLEENRVLRAVNASRRVCLTDDQRRRLAVKGHVLGRRQLAAVAGIVTPDTILRWYRTLVAQKYDGSQTRRPGRPTTKPDIAALIVRMANENPTWGDTRIRGGLKHLGHDVARNTIKAILKDHGVEP